MVISKRIQALMPTRLSLSLPLLFASLMVLAAPVLAQDFEGRNITALDIRYNGAKTINENVLRNQISSKPGTVYRADNLDNDITALYESGYVDDVTFLAEPVGENGVRLIAEVTTRPIREAIGFVGNTVVDDRKLAEETGLGPSGIMSDAAILEARRNLEQYYRDIGYPDVVVTHRVEPTDRKGFANLLFVIDEGLKFEIRKIRFEGNQAFSDRELRREMDVKEKGWFSWLTKSGRFEPDELDSSLDKVLDFYRSKGYLRVSSPGIRREVVGDGRVDLIIPINEGAKYTVDSVGFGKMSVFEPEELRPGLSLVGGDAYSSEKMRQDIKMIRSYYGSRGYADASVNPDIQDAGPNRVKIIYRITEGEQFEVGRINIAGNTKTKDKVIRRELALQPGDNFNTVELETSEARLKNLQYFSRVDVTGVPAGGGYRDIDVLVEEKKTGSIGVGVGFSSVDSVVGFFNLEQSNFDLFNPWNFTGGGQRFALNLRLGTERNEASISITEPWFMDRQLALGTELFYRDSTYFSDVYEQTNVGAAISLRKPLTSLSFVRAELRAENVEIDSEVNGNDTFSPGAAGNTDITGDPTDGANSLLSDERIGGDYSRIALGLSYVYDSRDSPIIARSGQKYDIGLTYAGFGADVETYTLSAQASSHWNFRYDTILSVTGEMAFVDGSGEIPVFERMFLGGPRTLRGFEFRDVGPRDSGYTEEVYGGSSLAYISTEFSVPLMDTIRGVVFADAGFVNEDSWDPAPDDIYSDVGIGVRFILPISPVPLALDYAVPVSSPDDEADKGGQFNFSLQTAF
ncbi:MAG: outer membrane protein assembly factor BamA [Akkermansiaceae bacterium]|nr:outer membrane protein assembly factor BamA [Akkermansiaceae bacterium]